MIRIAFAALFLLAAAMAASAGEKPSATLYKSPGCPCCDGHAAYLTSEGYPVEVEEVDDLAAFKREHAIPPALSSCHTILIDGYVVEGHMPASAIERLLRERPAIRGIALPGMPIGTPGMPGPKDEPWHIYEIADGEPKVYMTE